MFTKTYKAVGQHTETQKNNMTLRSKYTNFVDFFLVKKGPKLSPFSYVFIIYIQYTFLYQTVSLQIFLLRPLSTFAYLWRAMKPIDRHSRLKI